VPPPPPCQADQCRKLPGPGQYRAYDPGQGDPAGRVERGPVRPAATLGWPDRRSPAHRERQPIRVSDGGDGRTSMSAIAAPVSRPRRRFSVCAATMRSSPRHRWPVVPPKPSAQRGVGAPHLAIGHDSVRDTTAPAGNDESRPPARPKLTRPVAPRFNQDGAPGRRGASRGAATDRNRPAEPARDPGLGGKSTTKAGVVSFGLSVRVKKKPRGALPREAAIRVLWERTIPCRGGLLMARVGGILS